MPLLRWQDVKGSKLRATAMARAGIDLVRIGLPSVIYAFGNNLLIIAVIWTFLVRRNALDAAIELDRRFGLKERVSTSLALTTEDRESQIGRALLDDASRRVAQVRVSEQFVIAPGWRVMIPLAPIIATGDSRQVVIATP